MGVPVLKIRRVRDPAEEVLRGGNTVRNQGNIRFQNGRVDEITVRLQPAGPVFFRGGTESIEGDAEVLQRRFSHTEFRLCFPEQGVGGGALLVVSVAVFEGRDLLQRPGVRFLLPKFASERLGDSVQDFNRDAVGGASQGIGLRQGQQHGADVGEAIGFKPGIGGLDRVEPSAGANEIPGGFGEGGAFGGGAVGGLGGEGGGEEYKKYGPAAALGERAVHKLVGLSGPNIMNRAGPLVLGHYGMGPLM